MYAILTILQVTRRRWKTTALRGPPSPSLIWGVAKLLLMSSDAGSQYEKWAEEYGMVYEIPSVLGAKKIVLCDPKAITHFYGAEPRTYVLTPFLKLATETLVGTGILAARGEYHRRQRKTLTPAFSNAAIRNLTPVFYDSAYKAKYLWDSLIECNGGVSAIIDVHEWMNRISLDTIGIAGFAHDFGALDGKPVPVTEALHAFGNSRAKPHNLLLLLLASEAFPWLLRLPTPHSKIIKKLNDTVGKIANVFLMKLGRGKETGTLGEREEKSILGLLTKPENKERQREEVIAQAKLLLLAGYESTSISLTWALIALSKNQDIQRKLRAELVEFGADPTFDQLANELPYLDAVVHETFRLYAPAHDFTRMAVVDDVIPLSQPIYTRRGKLVDHISVAKGTYLCVSVPAVNRSTMLWGADAKEFNPERWIEKEGIPDGAKGIHGHRHLLTFLDGPRICLGRWFAIAEFKVVLAVLVKHFVFELRDGPDTEIETVATLLMRPKVAGEEGIAVPMRVSRIE